MKIHVKLKRKDAEIKSDSCVVEKVIELSGAEFTFFKDNLLNDYDFILENTDIMRQDENGVYHCLLVLGEGHDDGVLVESEGSFYARYSALVPNARQILQQMKYDPVLTEFCDEVQNAVDRMIQDAGRYHQNGTFRIWPESYIEEYDVETYCPILYKMLLSRKEIEEVEDGTNQFLVRMSPDYISSPKELKSISSEQFEIICAKHLLWLYDEGGEQADFANCDLSGLDLTRRNLNNALFTGARLYGASLDSSQLCFADFTGADLRDCSLRGITADEIVMKNAVVYNCDFSAAVLMHGNFTGSDLTGSKFLNTILQNACFDSAKIPKDLLVKAEAEHFSMNEQEWDESSGPVLSM